LFGGPDFKYVVNIGNHLLVVNTSGQVWARVFTATTVGGGYQINGPALFDATSNDKYVVSYSVVKPVPLQ
jgi:hypothetical protein